MNAFTSLAYSKKLGYTVAYKHMLAFLMASHSRLGNTAGLLQSLPFDLFRAILTCTDMYENSLQLTRAAGAMRIYESRGAYLWLQDPNELQFINWCTRFMPLLRVQILAHCSLQGEASRTMSFSEWFMHACKEFYQDMHLILRNASKWYLYRQGRDWRSIVWIFENDVEVDAVEAYLNVYFQRYMQKYIAVRAVTNGSMIIVHGPGVEHEIVLHDLVLPHMSMKCLDQPTGLCLLSCKPTHNVQLLQ